MILLILSVSVMPYHGGKLLTRALYVNLISRNSGSGEMFLATPATLVTMCLRKKTGSNACDDWREMWS